MKVLYISGASGADYQCDMLFHGLRSLLGPDLVDVNKIHFMYQGWPYPPFFSVYALLPEIEVDREDISRKILSKHFDAIIYGSIQRCKDFMAEVFQVYTPDKIAFIDGEDDNVILHDFRGRGMYFKRELLNEDWVLPIHFGIPKEKIIPVGNLPEKDRLLAPCDPRDRTTYIYYGDEAAYYNQYSQSYFGWTMKKGGWDCCRHYEILAAGAIPCFEKLEECPPRTLFRMPKDLLTQAWRLYHNWDDTSWVHWASLAHSIRDVMNKDLTTEAIAKYVLGELKCK